MQVTKLLVNPMKTKWFLIKGQEEGSLKSFLYLSSTEPSPLTLQSPPPLSFVAR